MLSIKLNRSFQFFVGLGVMLLAYRLWQMGFFSMLVYEAEGAEGFSSVASSALDVLLPLVFDTVCLIGLLALSAIGMGWRAISPLINKGYQLVDAKVEELTGFDLPNLPSEHPTEDEIEVEDEPELDVNALENVLTSISDRLAKLEVKDSE